MNNTINTGLNNLLKDLNPKLPAQTRPGIGAQKPPANLDKAQASDLSALIEASHSEGSEQLERAVAKILNRLIEGLQTKQGLSALAEQAKNTPLSKNISKDLAELITHAKNSPELEKIASKLESLINPKDAKALEHSLNNSGVFYESKLRAALNKEVLPKSFFRLISFMKNLKSPELKAQIFALGDENMDAKESLKTLDNFIKEHLGNFKKGADKAAKQAASSSAHNATKAQTPAAEPKLSSAVSNTLSKSQLSALRAQKTHEAAKNPLDDQQIIKLANSLNQAQKYLAKSPQKAPQIAAKLTKELDAAMLKILMHSPNDQSPKKLAALKSELMKFFKAPPNQAQQAKNLAAELAHQDKKLPDVASLIQQDKASYKTTQTALKAPQPEQSNNLEPSAKQEPTSPHKANEMASAHKSTEPPKEPATPESGNKAPAQQINSESAPSTQQTNTAANAKSPANSQEIAQQTQNNPENAKSATAQQSAPNQPAASAAQPAAQANQSSAPNQPAAQSPAQSHNAANHPAAQSPAQPAAQANQSSAPNQPAAQSPAQPAASNHQPAAQQANQPAASAAQPAASSPAQTAAPTPALPPHMLAAKPDLSQALNNAAFLLTRANSQNRAELLNQAAKMIDQAIAAEPSKGANANVLGNKIKSVATMLEGVLKGAPNYEKSVQQTELKQLASLLNHASKHAARMRDNADIAALKDDCKALLLSANEIADKSGDVQAKQLASKALAQIELNQLISASSAEIFTHLPYDFSSLEHASVGFRSDGDDKFSAQIKLDFKYLGKINVMLALEDEKYLQINIMAQSDELQNELVNHAQEFKKNLRKAGLIVSGFFISRLMPNQYESDENMQIGLNLKI